MAEYRYAWQGEPLAALLENDKTELGRKIDLANVVIRERITELARYDHAEDMDVWSEEHLALQDALRTLRYLRTLVVG
jgi:hypothetical protein